MGRYLNPDELGLALQRTGSIELKAFGLEPEPGALGHYLHANRGFVHKAQAAGEPITLYLHESSLRIQAREQTGYTAALASGFIRDQLIASGQSFAFESVLSDPGKLLELQAAKTAAYRIYLYFVCTENPDFNVARVANRARLGGHFVSEERIRERYDRTLANLLPAFLLSDRAYLFDNSGAQMELIMESNGKDLRLLTQTMPAWLEDHLILPLRSREAR